MAFFRKAGTIIVPTTIIIWFLKYFNFSLQHMELEQSMLADIGRFLSPVFAPPDFGSWQLITVMITSFVAKDDLLATMGVMFDEDTINGAMSAILPPVNAVPFLLSFILSCPCFATTGTIRKKLGSAKLTWQAIGFQMGTSYPAALVAYQILRFVL